MIYNTEVFEVSDLAAFKGGLESLRGALTAAGGTDIRIYRCIGDPTRILVAMCWPDAGSCRAFSSEHKALVDTRLRPSITSHEPEELWEEI